MNPSDLAAKKRDGQVLSRSELSPFLSGYANGSVADEEMIPFLRAVHTNGMADEEIIIFTELMIDSGEKLDFSHLNSFPADKHSTGGVGDKVSLVLAPILATLGLAVPMIAGRSLGHTGGTLDKLESIPGFQTQLSLNAFRHQVETVGACIIGQSKEICPVDKRMYALRDVTGTIDSIPLICGSIMSKKIAEGIRGLVLDIKVGNGAFMKSLQNAQELGSMMIKIGNHFGVKTEIVYSSMNQPLGVFAGNWCEVKESVECLRGNGPEDTMQVIMETGTVLLLQSQVVSTKEEAIDYISKSIQSGTAYEKWIEMVTAQSGDSSVFDSLEKQNTPECTSEILAESSGFISEMDTLRIGNAGIPLGMGRANKNDQVDPTSGMEFLAKIGDEVQEGEPLIRLFNSNRNGMNNAKPLLNGTVVISEDEPKLHQLILGKS